MAMQGCDSMLRVGSPKIEKDTFEEPKYQKVFLDDTVCKKMDFLQWFVHWEKGLIFPSNSFDFGAVSSLLVCTRKSWLLQNHELVGITIQLFDVTIFNSNTNTKQRSVDSTKQNSTNADYLLSRINCIVLWPDAPNYKTNFQSDMLDNKEETDPMPKKWTKLL